MLHGRSPVRLAIHEGQAGRLFNGGTIGPQAGEGAGLAKRRHGDRDHAGTQAALIGLTQAQPVHDARTLVLDHQIGSSHDRFSVGLAAGCRQIEVQPALVAVGRQKIARQLVQRRILRLQHFPAAPPVGLRGGFDLEHVGAQIGEIARRQRPRPAHAEVRHAHTVQWPRRAAVRSRPPHGVKRKMEGQGGRRDQFTFDPRERASIRPVRQARQIRRPGRRGDGYA